MTRLWSPIAQSAAVSGVPAPVIVDRPQANELQPTDGTLDSIKDAGFFVMGPDTDIDNYIGTDSVEEARQARLDERKRFPLPSTRGQIESPFGSRQIIECSYLFEEEPLSTTQMYYALQERMLGARSWYDVEGKMLPSLLSSRAIGEGGISIVYPGREGFVLKFSCTNCSAERLHIVHAALHLFGISHLEIRTDDIALNVARVYGIVEQRELPENSKQLREMTRGHGEMNQEALRRVGDEVGNEARQELEELAEQVHELNDDMLLHNEALFRGYSIWDTAAMVDSDRYITFVCDAFRCGQWNLNVFFNPDPSMRWFLLDW